MNIEVDLSVLQNLSNHDLIKMAKENDRNVFWVKRKVRELLQQLPPSTTPEESNPCR